MLSIVAASLLLATPAPRVVQVATAPALVAALGAAQRGDRIVLAAGRYAITAPLVVSRTISLEGEGAAVIEGAGGHELLQVLADSVTIRGITFRHVETSYIDDRAAIRVIDGQGCIIEGNTFEGTFFGVYLQRAGGCRIANNAFDGQGKGESSSGNGIHLWNSSGTVIEYNTIRGHRDGIYLEFAHQVTVTGNRSAENFRYGLHFMFSDSCAYRKNELLHNGAGVAVMHSKQVSMSENRFEDARGAGAYGLLLREITSSELDHNTFAGNSTALLMDGASRVIVRENLFERNGWAVKLLASGEANRFEGNTFSGNSFDVTTNSSASHSTFDGNHWDRYRGYDLNRDGVGDVPFHPVRLFAVMVQQDEPALILLRSLLVDVLELAERVLPVLTPIALVDGHPRLERTP